MISLLNREDASPATLRRTAPSRVISKRQAYLFPLWQAGEVQDVFLGACMYHPDSGAPPVDPVWGLAMIWCAACHVPGFLDLRVLQDVRFQLGPPAFPDNARRPSLMVRANWLV